MRVVRNFHLQIELAEPGAQMTWEQWWLRASKAPYPRGGAQCVETPPRLSDSAGGNDDRQ